MSMEIVGTTVRISSGFRRVVDVFLAVEALPFSQILSAERIERICGQHGSLFGQHGIFSTSLVLWAFMILAMLHGRGVHACKRQHQRRSSDLRRGRGWAGTTA